MNLVTPAAWCAALFIAASLFSHTVALRLLLLFGGVLLLLAETIRIRLRKVDGAVAFVPPLVLPFALWAAWAAASFLWTLDPGLTRKEFQNEIVYAFLAFWLCYAAAQAPSAPRIVGGVAAAGALAVCVLALAQSATERLYALQLHGGPGAFASTVLILYPCTLAAAWFARARRWHPAWPALILLFVPIYASAGYSTLNRMLWIGFAVEAAIAALLLLARPALRRPERIVIGVLAGVMIAAAGALAVKVQGERLGVRGASAEDGGASAENGGASAADGGASAADPRPKTWRIVLDRIEQRPLTGIGFGRGILRHELRAQGQNAHLWHSHNLFLDTALQVGWPGLALLFLLFGWTAALAWRLARSASEIAFACGLALLPLVAGTMVRNLTDVLWVRNSALLYWAAVGVLLAWGLRNERAAQ